ncbi:hypothetical protein [Streptomyces microflavus]|uniref:Uncharacterized protein n=1 Tax=Streptomyces microflavus TaxID=1919 RepID=A0ABV1QEN6_STRMI
MEREIIQDTLARALIDAGTPPAQQHYSTTAPPPATTTPTKTSS